MKDLTIGSTTKTILAMAIPVAAGMIFQTLYLLVDLYFVAALGEDSVAGVGTAGTLLFMIMALTQVLGVSAVALISQAVGRKDQEHANLVFNQSLVLSAVCAVITLLGGYLLAESYLGSITADDAALREGLTFLYWFLPGMALQFAMMAMASSLRATGIVKPAMIVQVLTVVLNTILAPILIAGWGPGPALGVLGAGLASTISITVGGVIAYFSGMPWEASLIIGAILALSSTALVGKQLSEQLEMQSRHGRLSISVLLFQDIAVVPFLVIIPILASDGSQNLSIALLIALAKGALAFAIMYGIGRYALRPVFHAVSSASSSELFTLTTLLIALTAAAITASLGLSLALGAFLAGMMLGETEYRHQIEVEIRPFRDILMGLFFISVGGLLSMSHVIENWFLILLIVAGLIFIKGFLVAILTRAMGYENGVAFRTAMVLAHGSEFGFALLTLSLQ